jgi:uncharacterized protein YaiI (UPF0178 family)
VSLHIYIDGDACPVVANQWFRTPPDVAFQRVDDSFDAADDWIAERANAETIIVTSDILLADRCLKAGATVLSANGKEMDDATIGSQIAVRAIMADLRDGADQPNVGGPPPFSDRDRSRFLETLHLLIERLGRR